MSELRILTRKIAEKDFGVTACEEILDIIEDIASEVIKLKINDLNLEIMAMRSDMKNQKECRKCVVCLEAIAEFMWSSCYTEEIPIAHVTTCRICADRITNGPLEYRSCPICRNKNGFWVRVDACA